MSSMITHLLCVGMQHEHGSLRLHDVQHVPEASICHRGDAAGHACHITKDIKITLHEITSITTYFL